MLVYEYLQVCLDWTLDSIFRTWWFDPFISTVSFAVFINWYWYHERKLGLSRDASFRSTVQQWSSTAAFQQQQQQLQQQQRSGGIGATMSGLIESLGPLFQSLAAYWIGIYLWTSVIPPASTNIPDGLCFPMSCSELLYLAAEVVTGLFLYDAIFFTIHMAMHEIPGLRFLHFRHHEQHARQRQQNHTNCSASAVVPPPVESRDVLRHSLADGALQVAVNILVQRHTAWGAVKTRLARGFHNILVIWMLTESHSAAPTPWLWRRCCVGVREHYQHHTANLNNDDDNTTANGTNNIQKKTATMHRCRYQQFFGYLDDLRFEHQTRKGID